MATEFLTPPPASLIQKILSRLEELGIALDPNTVAISTAALIDLIRNTTYGKEFISQLCGFDWRNGVTGKEYELADGTTVPADSIYFLQAAVVRGDFYPPCDIHERPIEKHGCDECGILSDCTRLVRDHRNDTMRICNHCLTNSSYPKNRELSGGFSQCQNCHNDMCDHHPVKAHLRSIVKIG